MTDTPDPERNRLTGRVRRFAQVGAGLAGAGASYGANRLFGGDAADVRNAKALKAALGGLKGPLMKAAQMFATVPDLLPPELASEFAELQTNAPAMGRPFVRRRMAAELGPDWAARFESFDLDAAAAASLGQVHRATARDGAALAVKLQYPEMQSAVESDLGQLGAVFALVRRMDRALDTSEILTEIGDRLREELDYVREAKAMRLYGRFFAGREDIATPQPVDALCTRRLLSMTWLEGRGLMAFKAAPLAVRNRIASLLFEAWWGPMIRLGVIHGDPHLGNYTLAGEGERLNLLDFGCVRIFPPRFVAGVVRLFHALSQDDRAGQKAAYESWGFQGHLRRPGGGAEPVGALHLRPAAGRPGAHRGRRGGAGRLRPARGLRRAPGPEGQGSGEDPARVRVHGPRRHRPGLRLPAPGGGDELARPVRGVGGWLRRGRPGGAPG